MMESNILARVADRELAENVQLAAQNLSRRGRLLAAICAVLVARA